MAPPDGLLQQHPAVSRRDRANPALLPNSVAIDGRDPDQLLAYLRTLAPSLRFPTADGRELDWSGLFDTLGTAGITELRQRSDLPPHAALLLAFLELYQVARGHLNGLSRKHLGFYYREVLGLRPRPPLPDRAHLLFEPARNRDSVQVMARTELKAGDFRYQTTREQFVDQARVTRLHSVFRDPAGGRLRYALAADSADGFGEKLGRENPSWAAFGHNALAPMAVGFALAGPVLMLAEGKRTIELHLELDLPFDAAAPGPSGDALLAGLEVELSGAEAWIGPLRPTAASLNFTAGAGRELFVKVELGAGDEAVTLYDPTKLPGGFAASAPVLKVMLRGDADPALYNLLAPAIVTGMSIDVAVEGVSDLLLENDLGRLNPDKPFMPFGPQPARGSSFYVGSPETFSKQLDDYELHLQWQDVPSDLSDHYKAYLKDLGGLKTVGITAAAAGVIADRKVQNNSHFTASMRLIRSGVSHDEVTVNLFAADDAAAPHSLDSDPALPISSGIAFPVFQGLFTSFTAQAQVQFPLASTPLSSPLVGASSAPALSFLPVQTAFPLPITSALFNLRQQRRVGYIKLSLVNSFLHREFPYLFSAAAVDETSTLNPNPPYTPVLESISLDYRAHSGRVEPGSTGRSDFEAKTLQLFHVTPFGQAEQHGYLNQGLDHVGDTRARLLPDFPDEGSLLIGLEKTAIGSDLDLLFQLAEGSANPLKTRRQVRWSLLSGNHWRPFEAQEIRREQTNQLLRSGVVSLRLPSNPLPANTAFDPTLTWVRAAIDSDTDAVCRFIGVHTQAGEAELSPAHTAADPAHLETALPAGSIAKLVRQQAGVKAVTQPYASFGGHRAESDEAFATRVSERLRHRHRAVSRWDYAHLVLEHFPQLHSVKVLSHTRPARAGVAGSPTAPGHVTLVTVPDLRQRNAYDPLQPRTDLDTLSAIEDRIGGLCPPGIEVHAVNPDYEAVRLDLSVRFEEQFPFGPYSEILDRALQQRLSPWAFDDADDPAAARSSGLSFGGRLHKSELLAFVAGLDYVERVERIALFHFAGPNPVPQGRDEVVASGAASVLVSHPLHLIHDARADD